MTARKRTDEARQLAKWEPLIERVIRKIDKNAHLKWAIGDMEDRRQIARLAVLQEIRSPKFADVARKDGHLSRRIRSRLVDAARESSLIRIHHSEVEALLRPKDGERASRSADRARRVMRLQVIGNMDLAGEAAPPEEASEATERAVQDVAWAIGRLPATIGRIMGHLFGVAGYDRLSRADVARRLGIAPSTVRRQAYEGRRLLRSLLKDCGYTEIVDEQGDS